MFMTGRALSGVTLLAGLLAGCGGGSPAATTPPTASPPPTAPASSVAPPTPTRDFALPKDCDDPRLTAAMGALIKGKKFDKRYDADANVTCAWGKKIPTTSVTIALPAAKPKYEDFPEVEIPELTALGLKAQAGGSEIGVGDRSLYNQVFVVIAPQFRLTVDQMSEERRDDDLREAAIAITTWLTS